MSIDDEEEDGVGADDDESINDSASEVGWNSDDDYAFAHVVGKKRKNVRTHLICCVIVFIIHQCTPNKNDFYRRIWKTMKTS